MIGLILMHTSLFSLLTYRQVNKSFEVVASLRLLELYAGPAAQ